MIKLADLSQNAGLIMKTSLLADWMMLGFYAGLEHSRLEPSHYSKLDAVDDFMMKRNTLGLRLSRL